MGLMAETPNPTFLVLHPNGRFLYAVNEHENDDKPGAKNTVSAFAVDAATAKLTFLNKVLSGGEGPAHISIDHHGRAVLVANYRSGSVAALPIERDGRLGEVTALEQTPAPTTAPPPIPEPAAPGPHVHFVAPSPDDRFALAADPPLDRVFVYRFNPEKGTLSPNTPAFAQVGQVGFGPRHLAFGASGKFVYVNGDRGSAVATLAYDADAGTLTEVQTVSTLPAGPSPTNSSSEIQVGRDGRFLYVSNRGDDSIVVFAIDQAKGTLTFVERTPTVGKRPRYFTLDPSGRFLIVGNHMSSSLTVNRVDPATGRLTAMQTVDVPEPVCMVFVPAPR
jgi:6-phosphogluconolactonase